jgi:hypothetical protein
MFTKEDYNRLPIDVVVNLINQLEEERDMYRDKWRKVGKMYGTTQNEINMQKAKTEADRARMQMYNSILL